MWNRDKWDDNTDNTQHSWNMETSPSGGVAQNAWGISCWLQHVPPSHDSNEGSRVGSHLSWSCSLGNPPQISPLCIRRPWCRPALHTLPAWQPHRPNDTRQGTASSGTLDKTNNEWRIKGYSRFSEETAIQSQLARSYYHAVCFCNRKGGKKNGKVMFTYQYQDVERDPNIDIKASDLLLHRSAVILAIPDQRVQSVSRGAIKLHM